MRKLAGESIDLVLKRLIKILKGSYLINIKKKQNNRKENYSKIVQTDSQR